MSILPVGGLVGGAADLLEGGGGGTAFETALSTAASAPGLGGGSNAQLEQQMTQGAVGVMGGLMMNLANQALNEGMEDDGD